MSYRGQFPGGSTAQSSIHNETSEGGDALRTAGPETGATMPVTRQEFSSMRRGSGLASCGLARCFHRAQLGHAIDVKQREAHGMDTGGQLAFGD